MSTWIHYLQKFIISGCSDTKVFDITLDTCELPEISKTLSDLSNRETNTTQEEMQKALRFSDDLLAKQKISEGLILRYLIFFPLISQMGSPNKISKPELKSYFKITLELAGKMSDLPELFPSAANLYIKLGQGFEALDNFPASRRAYEAGIHMWQKASAADPATYTAYLATSISNLAVAHNKANNLTLSCSFQKEATDIWQQLAAYNPSVYLPKVAMALNDLGNFLSDKLDFTAATAAYNEAVGIWRKLAFNKPEVYLVDLAKTLSNFASMLNSSGLKPMARTSFEESLVIRRKLAEEKPDTYSTVVSQTLFGLGNVLSDMGEFSLAHNAFEEAVELARKPVKEELQLHLDYLPRVLDNFGNLLYAMQNFSEAYKVKKEALEIWHHLTSDNPNAYNPQLALSPYVSIPVA